MWRRVEISNFRSIESASVTLAPFTIVVGRNSSGKSNFADALVFARADAVLVLCDADNDCAVAWNASATALVRSHMHWPPIAAVMPVREYEGWLLANESKLCLLA